MGVQFTMDRVSVFCEGVQYSMELRISYDTWGFPSHFFICPGFSSQINLILMKYEIPDIFPNFGQSSTTKSVIHEIPDIFPNF